MCLRNEILLYISKNKFLKWKVGMAVAKSTQIKLKLIRYGFVLIQILDYYTDVLLKERAEQHHGV